MGCRESAEVWGRFSSQVWVTVRDESSENTCRKYTVP